MGSDMTTPTSPGWVAEVEAEQARAKTKHGPNWIGGPYPDTPSRATILVEECGEVARAVLDRDHVNLRAELVQVAACAIAWIEHLDTDTP